MASTSWLETRPERVGEPLGTWTVHDSSDLTSTRRDAVDIVVARPAPENTEVATASWAGAIAPQEVLALVLSELVTNALRHGEPPVRVLLTELPGGWLVDVEDVAPSVLPTPEEDRVPGHGGHGLPLVARLCHDTGWYPADGNKHVWARLHV